MRPALAAARGGTAGGAERNALECWRRVAAKVEGAAHDAVRAVLVCVVARAERLLATLQNKAEFP